MGTCNTLRTTETYTTENFTLIQLEEERQKLKKKELLKNMLTDGEFSIKGQCAINLMMTKLEIINTFLLMKYNRSFIQMTTGRLKSYDSVCKKMQKKELDLNFAQALEKINDLIGVRAVCSYVDDIYKVAELIEKQQDIRIIKTKDYIKEPKKSGYQSLHLILEVAMPFQNESQWIKVELQLRTAAMDYWANLDHQLRYKRGQKQAAVINEELQRCASVISELDQKMLDMVRTVTDMRAHGRQRIDQLCSFLNHQALDRVSIIRAPDLWAVIQHSRVKACTTAGAVLQKKIREVCHQPFLQFINTYFSAGQVKYILDSALADSTLCLP